MDKRLLGEPENFYFSSDARSTKSSINQHYHGIYEIYFMKSGACNYFIDDRLYEVKSGDLIFIPDGIIHKTNYTGGTHSRLLINCSEDYIPESIRQQVKNLPYLYRGGQVTRDAERIFSKISEEYSRADTFSNDALKCYTGELFFLFLRGAEQNDDREFQRSAAERAAKYVRENYCSQIGLSETADALSVSPEHLSRSFKRETGFGFCEYLLLLRLQKAEYMLKNEPGRSVAEVAYACGFNDSNYFSDKFKRTYGIPPSHMKRQKEK